MNRALTLAAAVTLLGSVDLGASSLWQPAGAQQQGYGQTMDNATGTGSGSGSSSMGSGMGKGGSVLDAVNPIDLMNKIRRNQALDDATPPGDAVDQALKDYQSQTTPKTSTSATVKAP